MSVDRAEDVVLHRRILAEAKDPSKRPVFHVRFSKFLQTRGDEDDDLRQSTKVCSTSERCKNARNGEEKPPNSRIKDRGIDFEPCSKLGGLNLGMRKGANYVGDRSSLVDVGRHDHVRIPIHEVIFSTLDKPKLLCQLSALLSDIGLNIREAHVFSTTDGYSLDVFVVDGWPEKGTDGLHKALMEAITKNECLWSGSSRSSAIEEILEIQTKVGGWEIDKRSLKIGEKQTSGSCGDLHHGTYMGQDVAIKVICSEHLNEALEIEFAQEIMILREIQHKNVVRFIGVCTKPPQFCIVTEYMPGGNLYDFLHKHNNFLELSQLLKFAIDVSKGMEYLHQSNIIHRDLKTANLLMDANNVVKVSDFGVARFQSQGVMTAETGTYRWMAPEVINHQQYDQKADVFSFAIVLWELATSKVPYDTMTPLQAALGVSQGLRPELPAKTHPKLVDLMQKCWDALPAKRPSFVEITAELEDLLGKVQANGGQVI
ncbi:uncharacterized protein A4U43_C10F16760 [Asparagus officinalis]|uniref:non-specific serine/threonine protein kinase n=2 Tax=Asparagus officinalis TaxID=4686 RepID=A0A5P1E3C0_ASPOF|nr:uncharacterized protein A4U43_C10F16760 [Asparagus officinalis]